MQGPEGPRSSRNRKRFRGLPAAENLLEAGADFFEIGRAAAAELDGGGPSITDLGERRMDGFEIDLAFEERGPFGLVAFKGEVLDVELHDALAEGANPILRIA